MATTKTKIARTPTQLAALGVGVLFLLVGILGFVPGVTTNYGHLAAAGHHSGALLLGLFSVSGLHNAVHLLFGAAGIVLARTTPRARIFLLGGGAVYAALWIYGLTVDQNSVANVVPLNQADDWLHLGLAVGMLALGVVLGSGRGATTTVTSG